MGKSFLQYDSGIGDEKMIIYPTSKFLSMLSHCWYWYCDETFMSVPDVFFQLIRSTLRKKEWYLCLASRQERVNIRYCLSEIIEIEPTLNPLSIIVDFEKAEINALENDFPWLLFPSLPKYISKRFKKKD